MQVHPSKTHQCNPNQSSRTSQCLSVCSATFSRRSRRSSLPRLGSSTAEQHLTLELTSGQQEVKTVLAPQIGLQHSRTASDIGAYLRSAGREEVSQPKKESPLVHRNPMAAILQAEKPRVPQS